jgi:hypothetical protein
LLGYQLLGYVEDWSRVGRCPDSKLRFRDLTLEFQETGLLPGRTTAHGILDRPVQHRGTGCSFRVQREGERRATSSASGLKAKTVTARGAEITLWPALGVLDQVVAISPLFMPYCRPAM